MSSFDFGHRMTNWQPIYWVKGTIRNYRFGGFSDVATVDIYFSDSKSNLKIFGDHPHYTDFVEKLALGAQVKITGIYIPRRVDFNNNLSMRPADLKHTWIHVLQSVTSTESLKIPYFHFFQPRRRPSLRSGPAATRRCGCLI